ncbi:unnamed protein product [Closterium sp. Naga37s-1]|nr:unnamed protein product [Closterium sp. Naga37s-1]
MPLRPPFLLHFPAAGAAVGGRGSAAPAPPRPLFSSIPGGWRIVEQQWGGRGSAAPAPPPPPLLLSPSATVQQWGGGDLQHQPPSPPFLLHPWGVADSGAAVGGEGICSTSPPTPFSLPLLRVQQ